MFWSEFFVIKSNHELSIVMRRYSFHFNFTMIAEFQELLKTCHHLLSIYLYEMSGGRDVFFHFDISCPILSYSLIITHNCRGFIAQQHQAGLKG